MSKPRVMYGVSNFNEFRENNGYYIDKTQHIPLLEETKNPVFLRPRRFGKSMWCSMLNYYYDIKEQHRFQTLFGKTYIGKNPTPHQGNYMVLMLNFSVINVTDELSIIERSFNSHCNGRINGIMIRYPQFFTQADRINLQSSAVENLDQLLTAIENYQLPPLYLIIDEYDNFVNQLITSHQDTLYKEITTGDSFFRNFFKVIKAGREQQSIANSFITGVLPITMGDLTSAYNIASFITLDKKFVSMVGYTQGEVDGLLDQIYQDYELPIDTMLDVKTLIKNHYNGYQFIENTPTLYNPTILSYFLKPLAETQEIPQFLIDENLKTDSSWIRRLTSYHPETTEKLVDQMALDRSFSYNSQYLRQQFNMNQFFQEDYYPVSFFYLGMLTIESEAKMRVPNNNILRILMEYFHEIHRINVSTRYSDMMEGFMREPHIPKLFADFWELYIQKLPEAVFQKTNENFYRTSFFSLCSDYLSKYYTFNLERSYPKGKSDLEFVGKFHTQFAKQRHVIEFKYIPNAKSPSNNEEISQFQLDPKDLEQLNGYCEDLVNEVPEAIVKKYVIYCFGNTGFKIFEVE